MLMSNGKETIEVVKTAELFTILYNIENANLRYISSKYDNVVKHLEHCGYVAIHGCKRVIIERNGDTITVYAKRITFSDDYVLIENFIGDVIAYKSSKYGIYIKGVV